MTKLKLKMNAENKLGIMIGDEKKERSSYRTMFHGWG